MLDMNSDICNVLLAVFDLAYLLSIVLDGHIYSMSLRSLDFPAPLYLFS